MLIYKLTNTINKKIYVGKTEQSSFAKRWKGHKRDAVSYINGTYKHNSAIVFAIAKYGYINFTHEIIDTATTKSELCQKEIYWIKELNCLDRSIGYNRHPGGNGGKPHTQKTKDKMSEDTIASGRNAGTNNPNAKLTQIDIDNIVIAYNLGIETKDLAETYNVHPSQICRTLNKQGIKVVNRKLDHNKGKTWKMENGKRVYYTK